MNHSSEYLSKQSIVAFGSKGEILAASRCFPLSTPIADMASNVYESTLSRGDCRNHALSA
jgi:hypothetical protein